MSKTSNISITMRNWLVSIFLLISGSMTASVAQAMTVALSLSAETIQGDANGDGLVNMSDVTFIISCILGQNEETFELKRVDVNGDGVVNIMDVTWVINIILNKPNGPGDDDNGDAPPVDDDNANPDLPVLMSMK